LARVWDRHLGRWVEEEEDDEWFLKADDQPSGLAPAGQGSAAGVVSPGITPTTGGGGAIVPAETTNPWGLSDDVYRHFLMHGESDGTDVRPHPGVDEEFEPWVLPPPPEPMLPTVLRPDEPQGAGLYGEIPGAMPSGTGGGRIMPQGYVGPGHPWQPAPEEPEYDRYAAQDQGQHPWVLGAYQHLSRPWPQELVEAEPVVGRYQTLRTPEDQRQYMERLLSEETARQIKLPITSNLQPDPAAILSGEPFLGRATIRATAEALDRVFADAWADRPEDEPLAMGGQWPRVAGVMAEDVTPIEPGMHRAWTERAAGDIRRGAETALKTGLIAMDVPPLTAEEFFGKTVAGVDARAELEARHADTWDNTWDTALEAAALLAYSGPEAMVKTAERVHAGEAVNDVYYGDFAKSEQIRAVAVSLDITPDEHGFWELPEGAVHPDLLAQIRSDPRTRMYFENEVAYQVQNGIARETALHAVTEAMVNKGIPGEWNIAGELIGRFLFDPMNIVGFGGNARRQGRMLKAAVADAGKYTDEAADVLFKATQRTKGKGDLSRLIMGIFEPTSQARRARHMDDTRNVLGWLMSGLRNSDEIPNAARHFVALSSDDLDEIRRAQAALESMGVGRTKLTAEMAERWGLKAGEIISPLESARGKRVSYALRQILTDADGNFSPLAMSAKLREIPNPLEATGWLVRQMDRALEELYPVRRARGLTKWNNSIRGFVAKYLHMGLNPGYAIRNAVQNFVQGAIDGVLSASSAKTMASFWDDIGYTPAGLKRGLGGGPAAELVGRIKDNSVFEYLSSGPMIEVSGKVEDVFSERAVYEGTRRVFGSFWRRGRLVDDISVNRLSQVVGDEWAQPIANDLVRARNAAQIDDIKAVVRARGGHEELWRSYDRAILGGAADEWDDAFGQLVRTANSPEALDEGIESLIRRNWDNVTQKRAGVVTRGSDADEILERMGYRRLAPGRIKAENLEENASAIASNMAEIGGSRSRALVAAREAGDESIDEFMNIWQGVQQRKAQMYETTGDYLQRALAASALGDETGDYAEAAKVWPVYRQVRDTEFEKWYDETIAAWDGLTERALVQDIVTERNPASPQALERLSQLIDDGHMPTPDEQAAGIAAEVEQLLRNAAEQVKGRWGQTGGELSAEQLKAIDDFLDSYKPKLNALRAVAPRVGEMVRDFAYHNYADKRNIDSMMGLVWQYPFWYTRTYKKWVTRAFDSPHVISAYFKATRALKAINADLPEWWHDQIKLPDALGDEVYVPLQGLVNPLVGLVDQFRSPERARTELGGVQIGKAIQELGSYGPSTNVVLSWALGALAGMKGDREAMEAWWGYQSQMTRALPGITAKLGVGPPGGLGMDAWLYNLPELFMGTADGLRFRGSIYDQRRTGNILASMVEQGIVNPDEGIMAAYSLGGDVYDEALQQQALSRFAPTMMSWLGGPGIKPRPLSEVELSRMWDAVTNLRENRGNFENYEDYRAAWATLHRRWPQLEIVQMVRGDQDEKDEALTWNVLSRLPKGWQRDQALEEVVIDRQLLQRFYDEKGDMSDWSSGEQTQFMGSILKLSERFQTDPQVEATNERIRAAEASLRDRYQQQTGLDTRELEQQYFESQDRPPRVSDDLQAWWDTLDRFRGSNFPDNYIKPPEVLAAEEETTRKEYLQARVAADWPDIYKKLDAYYEIEDKDRRRDYVDKNPELEQYWGLQVALKMRDPADPRLQFVYDAYDRAEERWPGIFDIQTQYFDVKDEQGKGAARSFLREHPELGDYWDFIHAVKEASEYEEANAQRVAEQRAERNYRPGVPQEVMARTMGAAAPPPAMQARAAGPYGPRPGVPQDVIERQNEGYTPAYVPPAAPAPAPAPSGGGEQPRPRGGGGGGGGGGAPAAAPAAGRRPAPRDWYGFTQLLPQSAMDALFQFWDGVPLGDEARAALESVYSEVGYGDFETWLWGLQQLYMSSFPSMAQRARDVPSVRYPHWLPGVRR